MLRVLLYFKILFNILICVMICRQKRTHLNPGPVPTLQPPSQPKEKTKATKPWVMPWILQRQEKGCYSSVLPDLIHTDIPGYQNFVRLPPAFYDLIKEHIHHCFKKSVTSFRKPSEVGLKLAITLRHLATEQNSNSLQYHWLVDRTTICKFVPQVC